MTPAQRLDLVLNFIKEQSPNMFAIAEFIKSGPIDDSEFDRIKQKLLADNYIYIVSDMDEGFYLKPTFDGWLFHGYEIDQIFKRDLSDEAERLTEAQAALDAAALDISLSVMRLTKWIAFGTIIAAVYYLIQIADYLVRLFCSP